MPLRLGHQAGTSVRGFKAQPVLGFQVSAFSALFPARAISTPAAGVGRFPLLAVFVYVADEYPAINARAGTHALEAGVVRLYGVVVVVILGGWVRAGCARLFGVHSVSPFSVGRVPGCVRTCGTIPLSDALILS